jgi:hypothetical protein
MIYPPPSTLSENNLGVKVIFYSSISHILMTPSGVLVISREHSYSIRGNGPTGPIRPLQHLAAAGSHLYRWNQRLV